MKSEAARQWVELREGGLRVLCPSALATSCTTALRSGALARAFHAPGERGREGATLEVAGLPSRLHLRRLRHGGALGPLLGDRYRGIGRARRELEVNLALLEAGAPVPTPVCAAEWRTGVSSRIAFGTLLVEEAVDARAFLSRSLSRDELERFCSALGQTIRRFHDAGGHHADLHLGNLLLARDGQELCVIDLDRCKVATAPGPSRRLQELMRLRRSVAKHGFDEKIGERGRCLVFESYVGGDEALRRRLLRYLGREELRMRLHSWRYPTPRPVE